jgi:hypothetical protein
VIVQPGHVAVLMLMVKGPFLQAVGGVGVIVTQGISAAFEVVHAVKLQGVPWCSKLQLPPLKRIVLQPCGAESAAAGDVTLSMMTGAVHAATPATAAPLMRVLRSMPRFWAVISP